MPSVVLICTTGATPRRAAPPATAAARRRPALFAALRLHIAFSGEPVVRTQREAAFRMRLRKTCAS
ncbi:MAG: hypothetical protein D6725_06380 [Planctomycetota bacterium]|nr:MAG: hypothetical protein D6725_06380 [Planctomycetota bacterium]